MALANSNPRQINLLDTVRTRGAISVEELADMLNRRGAQAEHAIDKLRAKFGSDAVVRGLIIDTEQDEQHSPSRHLNEDPRVRSTKR